MNEAEEVLDLINSSTPGAQFSITSVSFWKSLGKDEDKKSIIRAWLTQGKLLTLIPFEKLDPSFLLLAYEVIKEDPALASLEDFCRRYRCQELIQKMTFAELYVQEGLNVQILFAKDSDAKTEKLKYIKRENHFGLDWEQWQKFKDCHAKFILCILRDLYNFPNNESKRQSVNYFVANLFKKIDQINLIGDKKTSLLHLLQAAQFDFVKFAEQINNRDLTLDIIEYLKK